MYLDAVLADTPLVGGLEPRLGKTGFQTISVLGYPGTGIPGILDAMNRLAVEYRWMTRYIPMDKEEAIKELTTLQKEVVFKTEGDIHSPERDNIRRRERHG
jgi:type IV secretion system protein TrbE